MADLDAFLTAIFGAVKGERHSALLWPPVAYAAARLWNGSSPHPDGAGYGGVVCRLWGGNKAPNGYGRIKIEGRTLGTHRASFMCENGFLPSYINVCHHCDRKPCIEPSHLFAGSQKDNLDDMRRKGRERYATGEDHPNAVLNVAAVLEIRRREVPQKVLAERFGVPQSTISLVQNGLSWRHVT